MPLMLGGVSGDLQDKAYLASRGGARRVAGAPAVLGRGEGDLRHVEGAARGHQAVGPDRHRLIGADGEGHARGRLQELDEKFSGLQTRWRMKFCPASARLGRITGWPVSHSRSPRLHGFWLERYGIDGAYVPLPIEPDRFPDAIRGLMLAGFAGRQRHHPAQGGRLRRVRHGRRARPVAPARSTRWCSRTAGSAAATPTAGASWKICARHGVDPAAGPALILGAGGSARAIAAVLLDLGVGSPSPTAPASAPRRWRRTAGAGGHRLGSRDDALADHALLVNTTSLGMAGQPALEIDLDRAAPA